MKFIILLNCLSLLLIPFFISCNNNPVNVQQNEPLVYNKMFSIGNDSVRYELWSATGSQLFYGYNELGVKVYINGLEQTSGNVRFAPRMTHFIGTYAHGTPVKPVFNYDNSSNFFTGYASFIMVSDSFSIWLADFSHNGHNRIKDSIFYVVPNSSHKMAAWPNIPDEYIYYISLITPFNPVTGFNDFKIILNRSHNDTTFYEVDSASMYIRTLIESTGQTSTGNINPVWIGGGKYKGVINLPNAGTWSVFDSIIYQGIVKTNNPPPKLSFIIQ